MTGLAAIIDALEPVDGGWRGGIPDTWMQGRTTYGGLSAALALVAAQRSGEDLPPLRSAQVAFVGPLAGTVLVRAHVLRRGRTAAWVQADVEGEAGLGLRATLVFMADQPSRLDRVVASAPAIAPPNEGDPTYPGPKQVVFTQNFEFVEDRARSLGPAEWLRWVRLRDRSTLDSAVELLAVADCNPPGALKLAGGPAPISSMTWQVDLLGDPRTADGWFLLGTDTDHVRAGVSSQRMTVHDRAGRQLATQMQSVALFV